MKMNDIHYFYFQLSINHICTNIPFLFIIFFIEYYDTFLYLCEGSIYLRNTHMEVNALLKEIIKMNYLSPFDYLRNYIKQEGNDQYYYIVIAIELIFMVLLTVICLIQKPFTWRFINVIIVNIADIFITRLFALVILDAFIFHVLFYLHKSMYIYSFVLFIITVFVLLSFFIHINCYYTFSTGNINYPYTKVSKYYDSFLLGLKAIICFNKNTFEISRENSTLVYFLNVILLLYSFCSFGFFILYYISSSSFFIHNHLLHKQKMFFMIVFNLLVVSLLFFTLYGLLYFMLMAGIVLFSVILTSFINPIEKCYSVISFKNLEDQLVFIINLEKLPLKYHTKYDEEIKRHYQYCKQCSLCLLLTEEGSVYESKTLDYYHRLFLELLNKNNKRMNNQLKVISYDVFDILHQLQKEDYFNYKLVLRLKYLIKKYAKVNLYASINLKFLYEEYCKVMKIHEMNNYQVVLLNDKIVRQTKDVIVFVQKLFMNNLTTPNDIMQLSLLLGNMDIDQNIVLNNRENMQNYPIVLMRIANEELLNVPLNKEDGLMRIEKNYSEDFLNFHYNEDRLLIVAVNVSKKSYKIIRTGNGLHHYSNKQFSSLFTDEFRSLAMNKFTILVNKYQKNTKELFEFFIRRNVDERNLSLFKYAFHLTPGLKKGDFCIIGEYLVGINDIILSTIQCDMCQEIIYWANTNLRSILSNHSNNNNNNRSLHNISDEYFFKIEKGIIIKPLILPQIFSKNQHDVYIMKKNEIEYKLTFCFEFECNYDSFLVYLVKIKDLTKKQETTGIGSSVCHYKQNQSNDENPPTIDDNKSVFWLDDSSSVNTTSTKSNQSAKTIKSKGNKIKYSQETKSRKYISRFRKTSNFILFFCLMLIGYMLVTLFIELDLNDGVIQLYNIYTNLRSANRLYYTMISNIIGVICVGDTDSDTCVKYYELFTMNLKETTDITLNIYDYIVLENQQKMTEFSDRIQLLKLNIHQLNDEYCSNAYNQEFNYSLLSLSDGKLYLINRTTTFSNALEILVNSLMTIILDKNSTNIPVYAYSTDPYDFSHIYNPKTLSKTQFEYYNCFINYRSYLLTWNSIQENLYLKILERLKKLWFVSNLFMAVTYLLHLFLCGLLFFYLYSFLFLFIFQIDKIINKMKTIDNKRFYLKKLDLINSLCNLYEENSLTIMKKIDEIYHEYFKKLRIVKLFETTDYVKPVKEQPLFDKTVYFALLSKYYIFVLLVLVYYTGLFIIFIITRNMKIKETVLVVEMIEKISYGDSAGFNGLTLVQLMFIANLTEVSIGRALNYDKNDYLANSFTTALQTYFSFEEMQRHTNLVNPPDYYFELTCEKFYIAIEDLIINQIKEKYPEMNIEAELTIVCNTLNFLSFNDDIITLQRLFYELLQISKEIKRASFDVYLGIIAKSKLFDIFNLVFLFFQPLRTWMNMKIFDTAIAKVTNEETIILIVYLVINNLTEIILVFLLYFFLIKHIRKINKDITRVVNIFKIKQLSI